MHTHRYQTKEYGEVVVIVNGDWSGDAIVRWGFTSNEPTARCSEAIIPGNLLLEISKGAAVDIVRDKVISTLEQL